MMRESELDPGIRRTVMLLRKRGFNTIDSGDGVSKPPDGCNLPYPNVFIQAGGQVVRESHRLWQFLMTEFNVCVSVISEDEDEPRIQATYDPANCTGVVELANVDDALLFGPETAVTD